MGLGSKTGLIIFGVACASLSSGFGEMTFLSFTARYDKSTVSGWSSGTGVSQVLRYLLYYYSVVFFEILSSCPCNIVLILYADNI